MPAPPTPDVWSYRGLRETIADGAFTLVFQPILHAWTGEIQHYEAFIRFAGVDDGASGRAVRYAEECGLILDLDLAVTAEVLRRLREGGPALDARIAVNLSGASFSDPTFYPRLDDLLRRQPWAVDRVLFELTESAPVTRLGAVNDMLQDLRRRGFSICLDDFGAGAATFQYLSQLDVDIVKLDGEALKAAQRGGKGVAFVKALVALCRELAVGTVAEMVDSEEWLAFVRSCGIDGVQGHLFGWPAADIDGFAAAVPRHLFRDAATSAPLSLRLR